MLHMDGEGEHCFVYAFEVERAEFGNGILV
jgi:hypothetical protein